MRSLDSVASQVTNTSGGLIESTINMTIDSEYELDGIVRNSTNNSCDYYNYYNDYNCDGYEYDYDETVSTLPLEEIIPAGVIYGLTLLLGILGNSLVIFSISRFRRMRSITNIFLLSLASADLLLILICVPIKVSRILFFSKHYISMYK